MSDFMTPEIIRDRMLHIETDNGVEIIPTEFLPEKPKIDDIRDYCEGIPCLFYGGKVDCEVKEGWYARLSASGYLDCTSWIGPFTSAKKAEDELEEMYEL